MIRLEDANILYNNERQIVILDISEEAYKINDKELYDFKYYVFDNTYGTKNNEFLRDKDDKAPIVSRVVQSFKENILKQDKTRIIAGKKYLLSEKSDTNEIVYKIFKDNIKDGSLHNGYADETKFNLINKNDGVFTKEDYFRINAVFAKLQAELLEEAIQNQPE